jgi:hypothetical protein
MFRNSLLVLATTFAAGLMFANIYTSIVDAVSWGSDLPTSILTARDYYKAVNPGNFFRIFSPLNQLLALISLVACWKMGLKVRYLCAAALVMAVGADALTFGYFYPRNEIMFNAPIGEINAIRSAWEQWTTMNWFRTALGAANVLLISSALITVNKVQPA